MTEGEDIQNEVIRDLTQEIIELQAGMHGYISDIHSLKSDIHSLKAQLAEADRAIIEAREEYGRWRDRALQAEAALRDMHVQRSTSGMS